MITACPGAQTPGSPVMTVLYLEAATATCSYTFSGAPSERSRVGHRGAAEPLGGVGADGPRERGVMGDPGAPACHSATASS